MKSIVSLLIDLREKSVFPEISHLIAFGNESGNLLIIACATYMCVSVLFHKPKYFIQVHGIQKIRRMRRNENLSSSLGISAEFFSQFP